MPSEAPATASAPTNPGTVNPVPLTIPRHFTTAGADPLESFTWERRDSRIVNPDGSVVFELTDVEVPTHWDQGALDIVASKYFRKAGVPQVDERGNLLLGDGGEALLGPERSVRQVAHRLANAWRVWGERGGYFATSADAQAFYDELVYMIVAQMAAPNSPQWFNTGLFEAYGIVAEPEGNWYYDPRTGELRESEHRYERSAANACYILAPDDQLVGENSIMRHLETEARLFKSGSGSGANYSKIREAGASLSGGGTSSGLMSFLKVMDAGAGAIKSGGTTRRAAKMVIVDADHPDIADFIWCKVHEEEKVAALGAAGYSMDWQGEAYETVAFQNANHSVRLPEGFMAAVAADDEWALISRVDGSVVRTVRARDLWRDIAAAAWRSADPGLQFDDILNDWNTAADTERLRGTNPCCFVGETLVVTDAGVVTISELAARASAGERLGSALAYDVDADKLQLSRISDAWVAGSTDRLVEVHTAAGHVLRCTPEHRFLVDNHRWVPASELTEGALLTAAAAPGVPGVDKVIRVSEVRLDSPVEVFDLEVAGHHNFTVLPAGAEAATAGVVVHNSEHTHVDFTACNLASLNLGAFYDDAAARFDVTGFTHAVRLWTTVLEITVSMSHYPAAEVAKKTYEHRPLGLGFSNLGATLMRAGLAYDSDQGRAAAAAITALMLSVAYRTSAELAAAVGPADAYAPNRDSALRVLRNHRRAAFGSLAARHGLAPYESLTVEPPALDHLTLAHTPFAELSDAVVTHAAEMVDDVEVHGLRNMQVVVIAPAGTISFIMGCDTTGLEPDFSLVKFKKLAGGGYMRIVNGSVPAALSALGYSESESATIMDHVLGTRTLDGDTALRAATLADAGFTAAEIDRARVALVNSSMLTEAFEPWAIGEDVYTRLGVEPAAGASALLAAAGFDAACVAECSKVICGHSTTEGAPGLRPEHAAVFDCATECGDGTRVIAAEGHVRMLGAIGPFVSGAMSKTINLPNSATVEDIEATHDLAYRLGVKCVAVYRDGSKLSQPLSAAGRSSAEETVDEVLQLPTEIPAGMSPAAFYHGTTPPRFRLPDVRPGLTWRFTVGGEEVYLRSGEYEDGSLGEVFIDWGRQGSTLRGITGALSIMISQALQHGVPLEKVVGSLRGHMFEPAGVVSGHANLKMATSLVDAIVRILGHHYLGRDDLVQVPSGGRPAAASAPASPATPAPAAQVEAPTEPPATAPVTGERVLGQSCTQCGSEALVKTGSCNTCTSCGSTTGCA